MLAEFLTTSQILLTQASFSDHLQQYLAPVGLSWTLCYSTTVYVYSQYASDFHKHCDGKPNTVTIIKKAGYIFGGFTDIPWGMTVLVFFRYPVKLEAFGLFDSQKPGS